MSGLHGIRVQVCGFVKEDGRECHNQIKNVGERCWRHKGSPVPKVAKAAKPKTVKAAKAAKPKTIKVAKAAKPKTVKVAKAAKPKTVKVAKAAKPKTAKPKTAKPKPAKPKTVKVAKAAKPKTVKVAKASEPGAGRPYFQKDDNNVIWNPSSPSLVVKAKKDGKFALRKERNSEAYKVQTKGLGGIPQGSGHITVQEVEAWVNSLGKVSQNPKPKETKPKNVTPEVEGVLLCHGKKHGIPEKYKYLANKWICLDSDPDVDPDIVANAGSLEDRALARRLSQDGFDVAISMYCPLPTSFTVLATFIGSCRDLLKKGGKFIMPDIDAHLIAKIARDMQVYPNEVKQRIEKGDKEITEYMNIMYKQLKEKIRYSDFYIEKGDGIFVN